ncbi:MAG TPA: hypothetical protein VE954_27080 [Oligoflexus sp.]|uniref:hypothetical protein n=1 Tax=Oligoflexus sp. TaxID=1971216 RepID=UPI002D6AAB1A|nr:hypothetical protein [Oligoflexus sp.]HYX36788.1 hypothetical protein [Oligoflexus sp.]
MPDRIVREYSYAMSEKVEPRSSAAEPELVLDYDLVRVRMPNRAERQRRRREEAEHRAREQAEREQQEGAAASKVDAAINQTHAKAQNRRALVLKSVEARGSPVSDRVDASNTELRKSWTIEDIRREELMAAELLKIHHAMLSGYDLFPVFRGIRLCVAGKWGRVIGMNRDRCAMHFDGANGQSSVSWDDIIRLFDVTVDSGTRPELGQDCGSDFAAERTGI